MSGLSAAIGYLLGTLAGYGVAALLRRLGRAPSPRVRRYGWLALGVVAAVVVVAGLALWPGWQNQQRDLVGMEQRGAGGAGADGRGDAGRVRPCCSWSAGWSATGSCCSTGCWPAGSPAWWPTRSRRRCSLVAAVVVTRDVVADGFFDWANRRFAAADTTTDPGVVAPTSPTVSGSPASLVPWATLGEYGRSLRGRDDQPGRSCAPSTGRRDDVLEPIRVYVGLRSAGSPDERAALAVRELERTGAFRREVAGRGHRHRHRLGRPRRRQLARVPARRRHGPGRPAVLLPAELDLVPGRPGRGGRGRCRPVPPRPPALVRSSRPRAAPG